MHKGLTTLDVLAIGFFFLATFEVLLGGFRTYLLSHTTHRMDVELGGQLYRHLVSLPLAYFQNRRVGDSVARVRELDSIREFLTGSALTLLIDLAFTFVFFLVMWQYSPLLTGVLMASIPFYVLLAALVTPGLRKRMNEQFARGAENQSFLVESVSQIETVKSLALEPQMHRNWNERLADYVRSGFEATKLSNVASQSATYINKLTTLGILWFGAHAVMAGTLSVGQLVAFNMLAGQVTGPILRLVQLWQDFQQAGIGLKRLGDILNTPVEPGSVAHQNDADQSKSRLPTLSGEIRFEHVSYRYRPDIPPTLQDIHLTLAAGEVVGVVGRSGSGKSTLTKLIQRLYVPENGRVLIDGHDLNLVDTASLRRQIGVVLQENRLFNRSIRENIALAFPGIPIEAVIRAAKMAGVHEFISQMPEGYDTKIEEQGSNLSGGQRQRIAIARALISDPRILILDEATSALDYESEALIQKNMAAICKGRTVIVIAHRLSAVAHADRIIVLDQGRVAEQGAHKVLIRQGGIYAHLHACQTGTGTGAAT